MTDKNPAPPNPKVGDAVRLRIWNGADWIKIIGTIEAIEPNPDFPSNRSEDIVILAEDPDMAYFRHQIVTAEPSTTPPLNPALTPAVAQALLDASNALQRASEAWQDNDQAAWGAAVADGYQIGRAIGMSIDEAAAEVGSFAVGYGTEADLADTGNFYHDYTRYFPKDEDDD